VLSNWLGQQLSERGHQVRVRHRDLNRSAKAAARKLKTKN
jgi:prephenate dehydrogenase